MSVHCFLFVESRNLMKERIPIVDNLGCYKIASVLSSIWREVRSLGAKVTLCESKSWLCHVLDV